MPVAPVAGGALTTSNGTWSHGPTTFGYQWQRSLDGSTWSPVGANASGYVVAQLDVGYAIRVTVTATNGAGTTAAQTSVPTLAATGAGPLPGSLYAAPGGSDGGAGTVGSPFATFGKLAGALSPGQTGYLRTGTYGSVNTFHEITSGGGSGNPYVVTAYPGEAATVTGWISLEAQNITLRALRLDGTNTFGGASVDDPACTAPRSQALNVKAANCVLEYCNIFQTTSGSSKGVGIGVGFDHSVSPDNTVIRYCKIHDVSSCDDFDHAIYVSYGNNVQVYGNWIYNCPKGHGIQLYTSPTNAQVYGNVIDNVASGFIMAQDAAGCHMTHNVVSNTTGVYEYFTTDHQVHFSNGPMMTALSLAGTGNVLDFNDYFNCAGGEASAGGVADANLHIANNVSSDPLFVDAASHNYQLKAGSPAAGYGLWDGTGCP